MPSWKKVIVAGTDATLSSLDVKETINAEQKISVGSAALIDTSPLYKLDVRNGGIFIQNGSDGIFLADNYDEGYSGLYSYTSDESIATFHQVNNMYKYANGLISVNGSAASVGINTYFPDKALEINSIDGNNLRLTYNDNDGNAVNYTDFGVSSNGQLKINSSAGIIQITGSINNNTTGILKTGTIELGHASDTTLSRVSAGVVAIEGKNILTTDGGTLTNNITIGENTSIALDPALSADGKYSGITITGTAGATLAFGEIVHLSAADSRWEKVRGDQSSGSAGDPRGIIGVCVLAAANDGDTTNILLQGNVRADSLFPTLTVGAQVFISGTTAGGISVRAPSTSTYVIRVVGFALTADELYFNPSPNFITVT